MGKNNIAEYSNGTLKSKLYGFDSNKSTESDICWYENFNLTKVSIELFY